MKHIKVINITAIIIAVLVLLSSCSYFEDNNRHFGGGELLDSEKMSEIKAELFSDEATQSEFTKNSDKESTEPEDFSTEEYEQAIEETTDIIEDSEIETQSEINTATETETETKSESLETTNEDIVYWLESGKVWHTKRECSYIAKKENINSGKVADAIEAGKEKVCSRCDK